MANFFDDAMREFNEAKEQFGARLFFVDEGHKQRFVQAIKYSRKFDEKGRIDRQYGAAFYILTAYEEEWKAVRKYVPPYYLTGYIDFPDILKLPFSGGGLRMIKLAYSLYNGNDKIDLLDLISNLDLTNFKVVIDAIGLGYYGLVLPKQEELTTPDNVI